MQQQKACVFNKLLYITENGELFIKLKFKQMRARQTKSPMRSIVNLCEQSGY